jgi:CRISPR-associated protein Cmr6
MLPLHKNAQQWKANCEHPNPGLKYDKYMDVWSDDFKKKDKTPFCREFANGIGDYPSVLLKDYRERRHKLLRSLNGKVLRARTSWRFVSGLGASHALETGFVWHRTLGVPYLPGASVKGMVRAWLVHWLGGVEELGSKRAQLRAAELFGDSETEGMGRISLFDAVPETVPRLEIDIMNPHYSKYYADPKRNPPGDYYSPVPISFLTVAPGQWFEFALAPANSRCTADDLADGVQLLQDALAFIGCGAKTAVGYGVFEGFQDRTDEVLDRLRSREEQEILAQLPPLERKLRELELALENVAISEETKQSTMDLFYDMQDMTDSDKQMVAQTLKAAWIAMGDWEGKLSKKQVKKVKEVKRLLGEA